MEWSAYQEFLSGQKTEAVEALGAHVSLLSDVLGLRRRDLHPNG